MIRYTCRGLAALHEHTVGGKGRVPCVDVSVTYLLVVALLRVCLHVVVGVLACE